MNNLTKGRRAYLDLGYCSLDCYQLPSGELRIGKAGGSVALGHSKEWIGRLQKGPSKRLKALQDKGFTGCTKEVSVPNPLGLSGASIASTLSVRDFTKLCIYESLNGNKNAVVLLAAFAEEGFSTVLDRLFRHQDVEEIKSRIVHYSLWTYEDLEEVLTYNRSELKALYGIG